MAELAAAVEEGGFARRMHALLACIGRWGPATPPAAAPLLLRLLREGPQPSLRMAAARALGDLREVPAEVEPALREFLKDPVLGMEADAALFRFQRRSALGTLEASLAQMDPMTQMRAAAALAELFPERKDLPGRITGSLRNKDEAVAEEALVAAWHLVRGRGPGGLATVERERLLRALPPAPEPDTIHGPTYDRRVVHLAALLETMGKGTEETRTLLRDTLRWGSMRWPGKGAPEEHFRCALEAAALGATGRWTGEILALLDSPSPAIRARAVLAFHRSRPDPARAARCLHGLLVSGRPEERADVLAAVALLGAEGRSLGLILLRKVEDPASPSFAEACRGMGVDPRAPPLLRAMIQASPGGPAEEAARAFVALGEGALPVMEWALAARVPEIRVRVYDAVGALGGKALPLLGALERRLGDPDPRAAEALRRAILAVAGRPAPPLAPRSCAAAFRDRLLPLPTTDGGRDVAAAVDSALDWLARHQSASGAWSGDRFDEACPKAACGGAGVADYDLGLTGLALLAFLARGEVPDGDSKHGPAVGKGLRHLVAAQAATGCIARTSSYEHAIATLALAEAYGMTGSPEWGDAAAFAVEWIEEARNPGAAWRYGYRSGDCDSSVTGWMLLALRGAERAGIPVSRAAADEAIEWLDRLTEPEYGRVGYTARGNGPSRPEEVMNRYPPDESESLTAMVLLGQLDSGMPGREERIRKQYRLLARCPPRWTPELSSVDFIYWNFAAAAVQRLGPKEAREWKEWKEALRRILLDHQRRDPASPARGSWDPVDPWGAVGGRVYSTALNCLTLQTPRRDPGPESTRR